MEASLYARIASAACPWAWLCWDVPEGIAMMDKLTEEAIEEGMATAFVKALIKEIRQRHHDAGKLLLQLAASGESSARVCAMGGRALAYDDILRLIDRTKGE